MLPLSLPGVVTAVVFTFIAASIIAIIPVVILFAFIEKHLVGGLTAGSIK